jgi:signal transduction histidine kinase
VEAGQFEKYFSTIIKEIRHINLHIDQILELERNPMEDMDLNLQQHHLKRTLLAVLQKFESLYADESRRFELDCRTRDEYFFYDRGKLERMLTNLLSNAVKYTPTGRITLRALEDDRWLILEVEDTGSGIPQNKLESILERFSRAEGIHQKPGTGLGLNIIHHMVTLHSGELAITSREGEGSTFALKIPKNLVNAAAN